MGEFPLVIFTVLSQLAAGAFVTVWILDTFYNNMRNATGKFLTVVIAGITAVSLLVSLFHLGHPLNAYRALLHLGGSWLSREILLFGLFFLMLGWYYTTWQEGKAGTRKTAGAIISLVAILAVVSSGMVYVLPARPAWNNFSPVIFFLLTSGLLGPVFVNSVLKVKGEEFSAPLRFTGTVISISLVSYMIYVSLLISGSGTAYLTGVNMLQSSTFWLRIVVGWLVPLAIVLPALFKKSFSKSSLAAYLFVLILVGELLGREVFYNSIVALQVAGF